jgi:spore maturation protein CgeB
MRNQHRIVILGLTLTSSWGNGHATTYRGLMRELVKHGHDVLFLERDVPWYASNRDLPAPPFGRTMLYGSVAELRDRFARDLRTADVVVVGSYVPDGIEVAEWVCATARGVKAFYDIDTPVTLSALADGTCTYLSRPLIPRFDLYLSFTGGPTLQRLERDFGARCARALYCSFDPVQYHPERRNIAWDLGYMGTFSPDRQPGLERLLLAAARQSTLRFVVAGPGYSVDGWPSNVDYVPHVPARDHRAFYTSQRFTLNLTRADMIRAGHSPSVRLFEAAACGVPIISDAWRGLETLFRPGSEILISESAEQTLRLLTELSERQRQAIGRRTRARVLAEHTAEHRAVQLEEYVDEVRGSASRGTPVVRPVPVPASEVSP